MKILPCLLLPFALAIVSRLGGESASPAPAAPLRVPFPKDYQNTFQVIRGPNPARESTIATVYANASAAGVSEIERIPYPNGAIIVMEWAEPMRDASGTPEVDTKGIPRKGAVVRIDVMQRGEGYGAAYGDKRAGEWEFASYRPDGSEFTPPASPVACAACHAKAAPRDFVFRGRFPAMDAK